MYSKSFLTACLAFLLICAAPNLGMAQGVSGEHHHEAAHIQDQKFLGLGDGVTTCAVTGETLVNKKISGTFYGRTVYFCCQDCLAKAQKNPELYVRQKIDEVAVKEPQTTPKFLGMGDGVTTCPVTGGPINKEARVEVNGRIFYACSQQCVDQIKKNPDLYLKIDHKETHGEAAFLGKGDGVTTCPVTGEAIDKDTKVEIDGKTIYACCPGCIEKIAKNPGLYLKKN